MFCLPRFTPWLLASLAVCLLLTPPAMAQRVKKQLTLKLDSNSVPTGGAVTGTVSHNTSTGTTDVKLECTPFGAVTFFTDPQTDPPTVTISAGQAAEFTIRAVGTPQTVTITASADGFQSGSASLTIAPPPPPGYKIKYIYVRVQNGTEVAHIIPREANGMNNWGQAVGWYSLDGEQRAYLYDPLDVQNNGATWDLSLLVDPGTVPPEFFNNFTIASAIDINDSGDIVGYLQQKGTGYSTSERTAYVMRRRWVNESSFKYALQVIDSLDNRSMWGSRINEEGDVLCESHHDPDGKLFTTSYVYRPDVGVGVLTELDLPCQHLSDRLIVNGVNGVNIGPAAYGTILRLDGSGSYTCHRILPWSETVEQVQQVEQFDFDGVIAGVNGNGVFCGWAEVEVLVRKRYESQKIAYIWDGSLWQIGGLRTSASAMNINKDALVFDWGGRRDLAQLYHSNFGLQKLDDLVIGSDADVSYWFSANSITSRYLSDRSSDVSGEKEASHYGQIFGKVAVAGSNPPDHRIFVLTPVNR